MVAPQKRQTPLAGGASNSNQNTDARIIGADEADRNRLATLAAAYALTGHALIEAGPGEPGARFYAARWGFIRPLHDLDEAQGFLELIGGRV